MNTTQRINKVSNAKMQAPAKGQVKSSSKKNVSIENANLYVSQGHKKRLSKTLRVIDNGNPTNRYLVTSPNLRVLHVPTDDSEIILLVERFLMTHFLEVFEIDEEGKSEFYPEDDPKPKPSKAHKALKVKTKKNNQNKFAIDVVNNDGEEENQKKIFLTQKQAKKEKILLKNEEMGVQKSASKKISKAIAPALKAKMRRKNNDYEDFSVAEISGSYHTQSALFSLPDKIGEFNRTLSKVADTGITMHHNLDQVNDKIDALMDRFSTTMEMPLKHTFSASEFQGTIPDWAKFLAIGGAVAYPLYQYMYTDEVSYQAIVLGVGASLAALNGGAVTRIMSIIERYADKPNVQTQSIYMKFREDIVTLLVDIWGSLAGIDVYKYIKTAAISVFLKDYTRVKKSLMDMFVDVKDLFIHALNFIRVKVLGWSRIQTADSFHDSVTEWTIEVGKLLGMFSRGVMTHSYDTYRLTDSIMRHGEQLARESQMSRNDKLTNILTRSLRELRDLMKAFESLNISYNRVKVKAAMLLLRGQPGVGKTNLMNMIATSVLEHIIPDEYRHIFATEPQAFIFLHFFANKYMDGYGPLKLVIILDDFDQCKDVAGNPDNEQMFIVKVGHSLPTLFHCAEMVNKKTTYNVAELVIASTNTRNFAFDSIRCPEAVLRRFDLTLDVIPKEEYKRMDIPDNDPWSRRLDYDKLTVYDINACEFRVYDLIARKYTGEILDFYGIVQKLVALHAKYKQELNVVETISKSLREEMHLVKVLGVVPTVSDEPLSWLGCEVKEAIPRSVQIELLLKLKSYAHMQGLIPTTAVLRRMVSNISFVPTLDCVERLIENDFYEETILLCDEIPTVPATQAEAPNSFSYQRSVNSLIEFANTGFKALVKDLPDPKKLFVKERIQLDSISNFIKLISVAGIVGYAVMRGTTKNPVAPEPKDEVDPDDFEKVALDYCHKFDMDLAELHYKLEHEPDFATEFSMSLSNAQEQRTQFDGDSNHVQSRSRRRKINKEKLAAMAAELVDEEKVTTHLEQNNIQSGEPARPKHTAPKTRRNKIGAEMKTQVNIVTPPPEVSRDTVDVIADLFKEHPRPVPKYLPMVIESESALSQLPISTVEHIPVVEYETQGADLNLDAIITKLKRHSQYIMYADDDKMGYSTFVTGRVMMIPKHFRESIISSVDAITNIRLVRPNTDKHIIIPVDTFLKYEYYMSPEYDVMLVFVKGVHTHTNVTGLFMDPRHFSHRRSFKVVMHTPIDDTRRYTDAILSKLAMPAQDAMGNIYDNKYVMAYNANTTLGDCGSLIYANETAFGSKRIVGMHVAGGSSASSVAVPLSLTNLVEKALEMDPMLDPHNQFRVECGEIKMVSSLDCNFRLPKPMFAPQQSVIGKSKLYGVWGPANTAPCNLGIRREGGSVTNPLIEAAELFESKDRVIIDEDLLHRSMLHLYVKMERCVNFTDVKRNIFTFEESITGIVGQDFCDGIPRETSAGYPYCEMPPKGTKGKTWWFGSEGPYILDSPQVVRLKKRVEFMKKQCVNNVVPEVYFKDFVKDERKSHEKVKTGKLRLVSGSPLDYLIMVRMYFMAFSIYFMQSRLYNGAAVGINPFSEEWDMLFKLLLGISRRALPGDFNKFDVSHTVQMMMKVCELINLWYDDGEENARIRICLFMALANSRHVLLFFAYTRACGLCSGSPLTVIINSIIAMLNMRMCYDKIFGCLTNYHTDIGEVVYGDDFILTVSDNAALMFCFRSVSLCMESLGYKITTTNKDGQDGQFQDLMTCTFLKRGFRYERALGRIVAPLDIHVVLEIPYWVKGAADLEERLVENVTTSIRELSLHGSEQYVSISRVLRSAYSLMTGQTIPNIPFMDMLHCVVNQEYLYNFL